MMSALKFAKALPASTFARSAAQRAYSAAATGEVTLPILSSGFCSSGEGVLGKEEKREADG